MTKKKLSLFNIALGLIILMIVTMVSLLLFVKPSHKPVKRINIDTDTAISEPKPVFRKDGELTFKDNKHESSLAKIDIEIADEEAERMQGLMYRDSMPEMSGMLFTFTVEEPLNFWMKNTRISLDIIYISAEHKIVSIARNTKPYSLDQIPSNKPALYVVEVNAGFTKRHRIKEGDLVIF
jgi:uncharacterized protein